MSTSRESGFVQHTQRDMSTRKNIYMFIYTVYIYYICLLFRGRLDRPRRTIKKNKKLPVHVNWAARVNQSRELGLVRAAHHWQPTRTTSGDRQVVRGHSFQHWNNYQTTSLQWSVRDPPWCDLPLIPRTNYQIYQSQSLFVTRMGVGKDEAELKPRKAEAATARNDKAVLHELRRCMQKVAWPDGVLTGVEEFMKQKWADLMDRVGGAPDRPLVCGFGCFCS